MRIFAQVKHAKDVYHRLFNPSETYADEPIYNNCQVEVMNNLNDIITCPIQRLACMIGSKTVYIYRDALVNWRIKE